jgi:hypothetical protein
VTYLAWRGDKRGEVLRSPSELLLPVLDQGERGGAVAQVDQLWAGTGGGRG